MADVPGTLSDGAGHTHTNGLHWQGFPRLLWESLQLFCYTEPPQYDCYTYTAEGVTHCTVRMIVRACIILKLKIFVQASYA